MAKAKTTTTKTKAKVAAATEATAVPVTAAPVTAAEQAAIQVAPRTNGNGKSATKTNGSSAPSPNLYDEIRARAYELYVQRGYSSGSPTDDWLVAEREVMQRHHHAGA